MEKGEAEQQFLDYINKNELLLHKICRLYAFNNVDRQDLFQDIVIQLWKAFPKFRNESKFSTWLYRVAINTAISGLRKKKDFIVLYEPAAFPTDMGDDTIQKEEERLQVLYAAVEKLNPIEKSMVFLYLEETPYEEMEDILGISQGNLRVKMNRIKEKLRQITKTVDYGTG